jgi:hypothetical protein
VSWPSRSLFRTGALFLGVARQARRHLSKAPARKQGRMARRNTLFSTINHALKNYFHPAETLASESSISMLRGIHILYKILDFGRETDSITH